MASYFNSRFAAALLLLGFFAGVFAATLVPGNAPLFQLALGQAQPLQQNSPNPVHYLNSSDGSAGNSVQAIFSPGADAAVLAEIASANSTLDIMLYQFSYGEYKQALARAVQKGVRARIILEPRVDSNIETAKFLLANGVSAKWATKNYTNTHSKTMVVDARRVLVGSINWSRHAAKTNRESGVVVDDAALAADFESVFEEDWAKATEVKPA